MILKLLKSLFKKGFRIGYSTGKPFDPRNQKRTNPIKDMIKKANERRKKNESS